MYKNMEINDSQENKETNVERYYCQNNENGSKKNIEPISASLLVLFFVIYLILGIYAARLSWYSNTKAKWSDEYKILFAFFAFMFPVTYIYAHVIFKMDLLSQIKDKSNLSKSK